MGSGCYGLELESGKDWRTVIILTAKLVLTRPTNFDMRYSTGIIRYRKRSHLDPLAIFVSQSRGCGGTEVPWTITFTPLQKE